MKKLPRWAKWSLTILVSIIVVLCAAITAVVTILKPERLTPLVLEYAPDYIDGTVSASRIELTFWRTFPRLTLDVDSLVVISNALNNLDGSVREKLPQWADSLLSIEKFSGAVNIQKAFTGNWEIYDLLVKGPSMNIVVINDSVANYNIILPSDDEQSESPIPNIEIKHFRLTDSRPIRYFSLPDSLLAEVYVKTIHLDGKKPPLYQLQTSTKGDLFSPLLGVLNVDSLDFSIDGKIKWNVSQPKTIGLEDFKIVVDNVEANFSANVDMADTLTVNELKWSLPSVRIEDVVRFFPSDVRKGMGNFKSDLALKFEGELTEPYVYDSLSNDLPSFKGTLVVPECYVKWPEKHLDIKKFILDSKFTVDGKNLNNSKIEVPRLFLHGNAVDLDMRGMLTSPVNDPRIAGEIKGRVFLDRLESFVKSQLPGRFSGTIGLNTSFRFFTSQLTQNKFHKIYAKGTMSFRDFDVAIEQHKDSGEIDSLKFFTPLSMLRLDSDKVVESNGVMVDSLLSVSLDSDSLFFHGEGIDIMTKNLTVGVGTKNVSTSADTTVINPFGGTVTAKRLRIFSYHDSTRVSMRDFTCTGSLSRYNDLSRVPQLKLSIETKRFSLGEPGFRIALSKPQLNMTAHLKPRRIERRAHLRDSLSNDSTRGARRNRRVNQTPVSSEDSLTRAFLRLLNRWEATGSFNASRGRIYTPAFPINNSVEKMDLQCTTDSIEVRSLRIKAGSSNFNITGKVNNILKSVARRRKKEALEINFNVTSDTIHVDELSAVLFAGAAATHNLESIRDSVMWNASIDETEMETDVKTDTTSSGPFLVTPYLDATLTLEARNVVYMGLLLNNFQGELEVWDSAIRLRDLEANSSFGSIGISALYSAPDVNDMEFGMGMILNDFHIKQFLQVTPSIRELLPAMENFSGIINADVAIASGIDSAMNFIIPSMQGAVKINGDSLVLLDPDTFKSLSKWLMFKNKKENLIKHMSVEMMIDSSQIVVFPFIFDIDRYKLGVMGSNDLNMNLNYHVSVLKSPIPFKFGINIKGNPEDLKIRLGGAKVKENMVVDRMDISGDTRINLLEQLEGIFRRGANTYDKDKININQQRQIDRDIVSESLSIENDSLSQEADSILSAPVIEQLK